jgi:hypothetical protein
VSGAKGPYRVTPNLMVVIPTSHHVRMQYGYTSLDIFAMLLSVIGVAGVVWLTFAKPVAFAAHRGRGRGDPGGTGYGGGTAPVDDPPMWGTYDRLESELTGAFPAASHGPPQGQPDHDLDVWLGFPAGLDLARYRTSDYGRGGQPGPSPGPGGATPADGEGGAAASEHKEHAAEVPVAKGPEVNRPEAIGPAAAGNGPEVGGTGPERGPLADEEPPPG